MLRLLSEAGRSFLRAFGASLLVLFPGVLAAPNLTGAIALGIAALIASLAAGLKVIQVFLPRLTVASLLPTRFKVYGVFIDSFLRAAIGAFIVSILGLLAMPSLHGWRSLALAAVVGALTAGIRAVQGLLTPGDVPVPKAGFTTKPSARDQVSVQS